MKNKRRSAFSPLLTIAVCVLVFVLIALSYIADKHGKPEDALNFMTSAFIAFSVYSLTERNATRGKVR